jgi:hypothetical protein
MELDIYFPFLALAFEYQGSQHYNNVGLLGSAKAVQNRDKEKQRACQKYGITLIHVPYTWKRDKESIMQMIRIHRPECLPET